MLSLLNSCSMLLLGQWAALAPEGHSLHVHVTFFSPISSDWKKKKMLYVF